MSFVDEVIIWAWHGSGSQLTMPWIVSTLPESVVVTVASLGIADCGKDAIDGAWRRRRSLTPQDRALMRELWDGFREASPMQIHRLAFSIPPSLQDLKKAVTETFGMYPNVRNGLDHPMRKLLRTLAAQPCSVGECMGEVLSEIDQSDIYLFDTILSELGKPSPLIAVDGGTLDPGATRRIIAQTMRITEMGVAVLREELDAVTLNGMDKWVGGCHIHSGLRTGFRWNENTGSFQSL